MPKVVNVFDNIPRIEDIPVKRNTSWGRWRLKARTNELALTIGGIPRYWIDLDSMQTSAQCLDWIFQASQKAWMTNEDRGNLLLAISELIRPQSTLCSWGIERGEKR